MGMRDQVNNLLEIGSTIKHITPEGAVQTIQSADEWLGDSPLAVPLCFGCKRLLISCPTPPKRASLISMLPAVVLANCERALV